MTSCWAWREPCAERSERSSLRNRSTSVAMGVNATRLLGRLDIRLQTQICLAPFAKEELLLRILALPGHQNIRVNGHPALRMLFILQNIDRDRVGNFLLQHLEGGFSHHFSAQPTNRFVGQMIVRIKCRGLRQSTLDGP